MDLVSQNLLLTSGGKKDSTYVDDVFSTYLWWGNETARTIPTGVDNTKGALAWVKSRNDTHGHHLVDTERGSNKVIYSDTHIAESTIANRITGFTNNGFNVGSAGQVNGTNAYKYAGWNFRKQKGFFDIVTWTGNAVNSSSPPRQIAHNLGSVPGAIWVKCLTANQSWACYHRSIGATRYLHLSDNGVGGSSAAWWNNTEPTSTHFTVSYDGQVNEINQQYVAYVFAGGESTAATAVSVEFDGNSDYLSLESNSELAFGTGDFTIEFWVKMITDQYTIFFDMRPNPAATQGLYPLIYLNSGTSLRYYTNSGDRITGPDMTAGQWYHIAVSRSGTSTRMFLNGTQVGSTYTDTNDYLNGDTTIGCRSDGSTGDLHGYMSNVRVVKGTALYTTSFKPSTEPLTNITNTKLLCCNNSSATGATVTPGTITAHSSPTASTDSPFDDPAGFKFGEEGDQNIIKCGSFKGNQSNGNPVHIGWEPQWLLLKAADQTESWAIVDATRGWVRGSTGNEADDAYFKADGTNAESDFIFGYPTPTGFNITGSASWNWSGKTYTYIAIRRPDSLVGKPPEVGTDVFAMDVGNSSSTIPTYDSGFVVDYALTKLYNNTQYWQSTSRLTGSGNLETNQARAEESYGGYVWDSNVGVHKGFDSNNQAWMWKRGQGFDVVNYVGNQTSGHNIAHNLGRAPEMIWIKNRDQTQQWGVGHKDLNGGTNPWNHYLVLDISDAQQSDTNYWDSQAPTATHFTVGSNALTNKNTHNYLAMLFASVDGISKVGSYTGATAGVTVTTGFQPRFLILKNATTSSNWTVLDTTRGWGSGNDERLYLNTTAAQSAFNVGAPTSTGFTIINNWDTQGDTIIYYAHA